MSSIEKITAKKVEVKIVDAATGNETTKHVLWWNATIANLTLMALGSSAPEILLAVIETVTNLGACPGELGASTIVWSASFNLLVITVLSIYAVSEETDTDEDNENASNDRYKFAIKSCFNMSNGASDLRTGNLTEIENKLNCG